MSKLFTDQWSKGTLKSSLVGRTFRFKFTMDPEEMDLDLSQIDPDGELNEEAPESEVMAYLEEAISDYGGSLATWLSEWQMLPQVVSVEVAEVNKK